MATHTPGMLCKQGVMGTWCHSCKNLIAAAPELLAFAKRAHKCFNVPKTGCEMCKVIAKAEVK